MSPKPELPVRLNRHITPAQFRVGLIAAFFLYGIFGILDYFMLPDNYPVAWFIRFGLITPTLIIFYTASYTKIFRKIASPILVSLVFFGQLGIVAMIYYASPHEQAFYAYYAGLILIILWASFAFRLTSIENLIAFLAIILSYNAVAVFSQKLLSEGIGSSDFAWFLGNNFFLIGTGVLALLGSYQLEKSQELVAEENQKFKQAKEKAEESDRLKTSFLQNISHEIRTPMNSILGFLELLQDEEISDEEQREYYSIIRQSSDRMLHTMHNIIEVAKHESGLIEADITDFVADEVISDVLTMLAPFAESRQIKLEFRNTNDLHELRLSTDKHKFRLIVYSLVENAIKFTNEGSVAVGYECIQPGKVKIIISDTGIGIDPSKHELIFERFRQADDSNTRSHEGAGLGLTLAKAYTELLGGTIELQSEPGKGSTLTVLLNISHILVPRQIKPEKPANKTQARKKGRVLLIVEDDEYNANYLTVVANLIGIETIRVNNGLEAVEVCKSNPEVGLVLMDLKMPVMDGYEATQKIREFDKQLVIIAQTAYALSNDRQKAIASGCNDYFEKPIRYKKMTSLLKTHFD